jgi:CRISPR system Cascade subunit CasA
VDEPAFDLVDQEWVPVVGQPGLVSLRRSLLDAHVLAGLALDDPLQAVAVLRQVLLPAYLDACGPPRTPAEWERRWRDGRLDQPAIEKYLDKHRDRFDLFGAAPFGQAAGLRTEKDESKPVSLLIASAPTGNNVPLFGARTEADPPALTPAEAVRAVLAVQCWDTAAIKSGAADDRNVKGGKTTGNPTGPLGGLGVTIPLGRTLFETLLLNSPIAPQGLTSTDCPQWARPAVTGEWSSRPVRGLLDLLTWQARRVRLVPEPCGAGEFVVRRVVLTAGDRMTPLPVDLEPHTAWRQVDKPKANQSPSMPVRHVAGRAIWQGLQPMLSTRPDANTPVTSSLLLRQIDALRVESRLPSDTSIQVLTVGVQYGNQSAVVENVMADLIPLPIVALDPTSPARQLLDQIAEQGDDLRRAANRFGDDLRQALGVDKAPWDKGQRLGDVLVHRLSPIVRKILADLQADPHCDDRAEAVWRRSATQAACEVAAPVLAAMPPQAVLGRVVEEKKKKWRYCEAIAARRYRAEVRRILGDAAGADSEE